MIAQQKFPKDFLWGASTASHQVEGGTVNQWSQWELAQASDLAASAERRLKHLPDWPSIKEEAQNPGNYVSGNAIDHYTRYEEDFDLLQKLQFNSLRFGVEWSRIQPQEGVFDIEAIAHYHQYIDSLNARGVEPILNLWHWTMPTWFTDKGGFEKKDNLALFDAFVARVAEEYADKVTYVITLNEPNVYASFSYLNGDWPPQSKSFKKTLAVYRNLVKAHKRAYAILKARRSTLQVGVASQLANIQAKRPHNILDSVSTKVMRYAWNWWFLNRIRKQQDFVGINYYFTDYYRGFGRRDNPKVPTNDLGWYMEPEGLYPLMLRTWARYKKPIIVTENGVADRNDNYRKWWVEQTILAMQRALSEGVEIKGYMHWSLLDNFEWKYGWWPKFGLIAVDRDDDMKRHPRPSAIWFARYLMELQGRDRPAAVAKRSQPEAPQPAPRSVTEQSHRINSNPTISSSPGAKPAPGMQFAPQKPHISPKPERAEHLRHPGHPGRPVQAPRAHEAAPPAPAARRIRMKKQI